MDGIEFRPLRNLENQSKPYSHHPAASLHQKRENCSEENSHFGQQVGRMQLHVSHQKQAELVVVEIATESFFGVNRVYVVVDCTHDR